jgi:hypothetical protein
MLSLFLGTCRIKLKLSKAAAEFWWIAQKKKQNKTKSR